MRLIVIGVGVIATVVSLAGAYLMTLAEPPLFVGPDDDAPDSETRPFVRLCWRKIEEPSPDGDRLCQPGGQP